jgi:hypothetical protein
MVEWKRRVVQGQDRERDEMRQAWDVPETASTNLPSMKSWVNLISGISKGAPPPFSARSPPLRSLAMASLPSTTSLPPELLPFLVEYCGGCDRGEDNGRGLA